MANATLLAPARPALRDVVRAVPTTVAVVAGRRDDEVVPMIVGSLFSASIEPPMVGVSFQKTSDTWRDLRTIKEVGISVLGHDHGDLAAQVSGPRARRLDSPLWRLDKHRPIVAGALVHFDCVLDEVISTGDHEIALYRIDDWQSTEDINPLIYINRRFTTIL